MMFLQVSDSVFDRINELNSYQIEIKPILRISVEAGGCFGFQYKYELVQKIEEDDHIVEKDGSKVIIDPSSLDFIKGCKIEYIQELGSAEFKITNPNATSRCGCNNSFSI